MVAAAINIVQQRGSTATPAVTEPPPIPAGQVRLNTHQILIEAGCPGYQTVTFRNLSRNSEKIYDLADGSTLTNTVFKRGDRLELEFAGPAGKRIFEMTAEWNPRHFGSHTHAYFTLDELHATERVVVPRQVPEVPKGSVQVGCGQTLIRRLQLPGFDHVTFRNPKRGIVRTYDLSKTSVLHGAVLSRGEKIVLEFSGENGKRILDIDAAWNPRKFGAHTGAYFTLDELPHTERVEPALGPPTQPAGPSEVQKRFGMAPGKPWFDGLPKIER